MNDATAIDQNAEATPVDPVPEDQYDSTAIAVVKRQKLPALPLPADGTARYFKPAGKFEIDLDSMHAIVRIDPKKVADRAGELHSFEDAMCFISVFDEHGYEYRAMSEFYFNGSKYEAIVPIRVLRPDSFQVTGLVLTPKQADFVSRYLFKKTDGNGAEYSYTAVDTSDITNPKMVGYEALNWAIQTGVASIEVTDKQVRVLDDTRWHRWMSSPVFFSGPPKTNLEYYLRFAFAIFPQGLLWLAYMGGKAVYVATHGVWYNWFKGSHRKEMDWGAILDPDAERSRNAWSKCVPYSRADTTTYGDANVQSAFRRALVPAQWWKGILVGFLIANIFFAGTLFQEVLWSTVAVVSFAFLQFRIADNDGQYTSAWRYLLNNGGGMIRGLRISKLPYVGKYHNQINQKISAQSAKVFRPVVSPQTVKQIENK